MRKEFSKIAEELISSNLKTVFITADLGFNALEGIREIAQERFINAGVAEQNMIGVATGFTNKFNKYACNYWDLEFFSKHRLR